MSRLIYNGLTHRLSLLDGDYNVIGIWEAYNNFDKPLSTIEVVNSSGPSKMKPNLNKENIDVPAGMYWI